MPDRLVPYIDPWTTPVVLWAIIIGLAAAVGLRRRALAAVATAAATGIALWKAWAIGPPTGLLDLMIYTNSAQAWLDGGSLFSYRSPVFNLSATYPPIGLLPFSALAPLSVTVREVLFTGLSLAAIGAIGLCASVLAGVQPRQRIRWSMWAMALAVVSVPVWLTLRQGQVNALLWLLVIGDVLLLRRRSRLGGVGIGIATAVKLVPGLFIIWLLVVGWRRAAARSVATAVGLTVLGWIIAPADSRLYWTELLWQSNNVGRLDDARNNSMLAALADLLDPGWMRTSLWILLATAIAIVGLRRARRATLADDLLAALVIVGCTSALISPISWSHHLGYLVLAGAAILPSVTTRRRWLLLGLAAVPVIDPGNLGDDPAMSMLRMILMVAVVLALPIVQGRSAASGSSVEPGSVPTSEPVPIGQDQAVRTPRSRSTNS